MIAKVSLPSFQLLLVGLLSHILCSGSAFASQPWPNQPHVIEVFTSAENPLVGTDTKETGSQSQGLEITVYEIDDIQSVEHILSHDLPSDPEQSKRMALQRIQRLDGHARVKMQTAAQGLARAMEYGIDRYPAIVFDGTAVVYGVTDLAEALRHYRRWLEAGDS